MAPGAALAVIIAGSQLAAHWPANAAVSLPPKTAQQLLVDLQGATPHALSGTVKATASLGLPQLPEGMTGADDSASPLGLLSGTHTAKVWYDGKTSGRIALLGDSAETDLVANSSGLWLWQSSDKSVLHVPGGSLTSTPPRRTGPVHAEPGSRQAITPGMAQQLSTPEGVAAFALRMLDPSTQVTTDSNERIAGRAAYQLVLTPKTSGTTIGSIRIAFDAANFTPLRTEIFAKGAAKPAVNVGFSSISYQRPSASVFAFRPPAGASVKTVNPSTKAGHTRPSGFSAPQLVGKDWASVLVGKLPAHATSGAAKERDVLRMLPSVSGSWGSGHLLSTSLVNVVLTDDGRYAIGAVPAASLYAALGRG
ncbi:hypothetical protein EFY87_12735 [Flexivirga caeni]|uniref:DUF2092 domain-containing protein n=1 Tax=Flexivirga caeni TaxID=2294115 RepID=A0A3M9M6D2_9MICO|nr:hypothetical protein EFY87_12735 [Flexivirga caeni]